MMFCVVLKDAKSVYTKGHFLDITATIFLSL